MTGKLIDRAPDYVRSIAPAVGEQFSALRRTLYESGPLDMRTQELILLGAFATAGYEMPFKNHVRRAIGFGATKAEAQQAVLVTFASTTTMRQLADALSWIEDVLAEDEAATKGTSG
jgi:alkylhydroperoxidase/carboxymuconolactone decarboxylase family protein YurZ